MSALAIPEIPVLETERLILRGHVLSDFGPYERAFGEARTRYMGGPLGQRGAWASFCRDVAQWVLLGHGAWAVTGRDGGAFLGQVGLNRHPYFPETELGWLLVAEAEGHGYAGEAARIVRDWAYRERGITTLVSYIHRENAGSIALAERLGARLDPDAAPCPYDDHGVWRHPSAEELAA
ncbi:MAG: GNAT family N-acetyltransferase [Pseudomonadota bacterium]